MDLGADGFQTLRHVILPQLGSALLAGALLGPALCAAAALALDAPLRVTQGLMPVAQAPESMAALQAAVARHNAAGLAALGVAVPALGSLVLSLALSLGRLDAEEAHRLAVIDEVFQEEFWGSDPETEARRQGRLDDVKLAQRFIALVAG
jgi:chaperone required for assembly of F1-ATPase